jgi:hypothetical protein
MPWKGTGLKVSGLLAKQSFRVSGVSGMSSVFIVLDAAVLGMFDILS